MSMDKNECLACEMAAVLRSRSGEIRRELRWMNPITDPNYNGLYGLLVEVDTDLRKLLALDHQSTDKADA